MYSSHGTANHLRFLGASLTTVYIGSDPDFETFGQAGALAKSYVCLHCSNLACFFVGDVSRHLWHGCSADSAVSRSCPGAHSVGRAVPGRALPATIAIGPAAAAATRFTTEPPSATTATTNGGRWCGAAAAARPSAPVPGDATASAAADGCSSGWDVCSISGPASTG